jgi:hypothetical protein
MLNRSGESGTLVSFLILGEMFSVFSIKSDVGYRFVIYIVFIILRYIPSIPSFLEAFIMKWC